MSFTLGGGFSGLCSLRGDLSLINTATNALLWDETYLCFGVVSGLYIALWEESCCSGNK